MWKLDTTTATTTTTRTKNCGKNWTWLKSHVYSVAHHIINVASDYGQHKWALMLINRQITRVQVFFSTQSSLSLSCAHCIDRENRVHHRITCGLPLTIFFFSIVLHMLRWWLQIEAKFAAQLDLYVKVWQFVRSCAF